MGSPRSIWEEGSRERLGNFILLAPSIRDPFGLGITLTKDHSSFEGGPLHM